MWRAEYFIKNYTVDAEALHRHTEGETTPTDPVLGGRICTGVHKKSFPFS
jgi:hypothetical protein